MMTSRENKISAIREIVNHRIKKFVLHFENRYMNEVDDLEGVINKKKNNTFIRELGEEFSFYSAFVRSFDSSFGGVLENLGKDIAALTFEVKGQINSFITPQEIQHIGWLIDGYDKRNLPRTDDYERFDSVFQKNIQSYIQTHETDNYFIDPKTKTHYIIELKAGGDLDNKKAKSEKSALLREYFLVKNSLNEDESVKIRFATAYNKYGEGKPWKQHSVRQYFADEELLIGKDYWNFVCGEDDGFEIVFNQYRDSAKYIKSALSRIKSLYFN